MTALVAAAAAGQNHAQFAGTLSVVCAAAQEKAKSFDHGAQELASRQPLLDQLNQDLASSHKVSSELTASMTAAQSALTVSQQEVASLHEELASLQEEHSTAQVHTSHSTCAAHHLFKDHYHLVHGCASMGKTLLPLAACRAQQACCPTMPCCMHTPCFFPDVICALVFIQANKFFATGIRGQQPSLHDMQRSGVSYCMYCLNGEDLPSHLCQVLLSVMTPFTLKN